MLFGVSLALGAFFAGMMIRESDLNHEVADRVLPFQDAFAVLFFVAVGMLFDPAVLIERPLDVLATLFIIVVVKAVVTFLIVMAFRYPLRKALVVSVGLAQIGEFSFILLTLGASLGLMHNDGRDVILGGALISIMINPILMKTCIRWIVRHGHDKPAVEDKLAHMGVEECKGLKNLILLIGFGRVGAHAASMLDPALVDLVVIDNNREKIAHLRQHGFHAIAGDATEKATLKDAQIEKASAILITVPDPFDARRIVEQVRKVKPDARVLVRSRNDEETNFFKTQNVELSVSGTEEIARRMVTQLFPA
jgi:CPA2 family monovalent cation:H+ antiporter-2